MKENSFEELILKIDSDTSMDQCITERLLNYEEATNQRSEIKHPMSLTYLRNHPFHNFFKAVAAVVILVIISTTTVIATGHFKSYTLNYRKYTQSELNYITELSPPIELVRINFGEGHKIETITVYDADGNLVSYEGPEDHNDDDIKHGDEAFALLGLPNLIPTYLYDNYLVQEGGFIYREFQLDTGYKRSEIAAGFVSTDGGNSIFVQFSPSETSTEGNIAIIDDADYETSTYINKSGLICNISKDKRYDNISVSILYDSATIGNGSLFFSFTSHQMDEIEAILDSIPITESVE